MDKHAPKEEMINYVQDIYKPFTAEDISFKISALVTPKETKADVEIIYQSISDLHASCPNHLGDWYFTGDKASQDQDGYFWFVGRGDDVINSASYRIGPFEVESALAEHSSVAETAVIGSPDNVRGEIVKAFVVLSPGIHPYELTIEESDSLKKELQSHVKNITAPYKYPREIEFVTELPKTISGKIRRNLLRENELKKKSL